MKSRIEGKLAPAPNRKVKNLTAHYPKVKVDVNQPIGDDELSTPLPIAGILDASSPVRKDSSPL